ncbi:RES family NAD+ phosphorylase [Kitasatospora sp. NPDC101801]|uniref:RES family NAD+ phosphorylase n=1 Tax=Kitasatospora sp. NPDC101801 TaxID=3364103 RepID=UPI003817AF81
MIDPELPSAEITVGPSTTLFRAHQLKNDPRYYCTNGLCRFDPPSGPTYNYGTCCTAEARETAVIEHIHDATEIDMDFWAVRGISTMTPVTDHRVADLPNEQGHLGAGVLEQLQVGPERPQSQAWGAHAWHAGFQGIRHQSRRAIPHQEFCIAFFGPPGENTSKLDSTTESWGQALRLLVGQRYHVRVLEPVPLDPLDEPVSAEEG